MSERKNAGVVTAYGAAVQGGYEGTYEQFCALLADLPEVINDLENMTVDVSTLSAGSSATASYADGVLTLGIPKGDKGDKGDKGNKGDTGATPAFTIGTVTTGAAGTDAAATITGTAAAPVLNLTIPKGADGAVPAAAIAGTEATTTASKAYAVGDRFFLGGTLYIATAPIASGGTITVSGSGANCKADVLGDDVSELKTAIADITIGFAEEKEIKNYPIAIFSNAFLDTPVKSLVVSVNAAQKGSGTPSSSNIRPIVGWNRADICSTGRIMSNALADMKYGSNSNYNKNVGATLFVANSSSAVSVSGTNPLLITNTTNWRGVVFFSPVLPKGATVSFRYRIKGNKTNEDVKRAAYLVDADNRIVKKITADASVVQNENYVYRIGSTTSDAGLRLVFAVESSTKQTITLYDYCFVNYNSDACNMSYNELKNYIGETYRIDFPDEAKPVFGASLDITNKKLTVTHANIESYNGEEINEPWISSMDAFTEGATPTTGAQVVYPLSEPIEYNLESVPDIKTVDNDGNIWSNTGIVNELVYYYNPKDENTEKINSIDYHVESIEFIQNLEHHLVKYGVEKTKVLPAVPTASDSEQLGFFRENTFVAIDGSFTNGSYDSAKLKISGDGIARTVSADTVETWKSPISLKTSHRYRVSYRRVSGTVLVDNGISLFVYRAGESNTVGTVFSVEGAGYAREFVAEEGISYHICFRIAFGTVLDNVVYSVILEDLTEMNSTIKDFYVEEMNDTVTKVRNEITEPALVFPWVTDIHRYSGNASGVQNFADMIANMKYFLGKVKCDFMLDTGDLTDGNTVKSTTLSRAYACMESFIDLGIPYTFAIGNHDENPYISGSSYLFTMQECYKAYFIPTKGMFYNANENGMDYYIDFDNLDVRFIVLCAANVSAITSSGVYAYGATTAAWLASVLDTEKKVIVAVHLSPYTAQVYDNTSTTNSSGVRTALDNFVNDGGSLIMISGHSHCDIAFISPFLSVMEGCQRFTNRAEDLIISPTDENRHGLTGFIDYIRRDARINGTAKKDLWSVCVYKPVSNEFSVIRFGAGIDRYFHATPIAPTTVTTKLTGTITWSSSDTTVATVSSGVITGVATGKCAVLAKDETGNYECWIVEVD